MAPCYRASYAFLTAILYMSHQYMYVNAQTWTDWESNDDDDGTGDIEPCTDTMCGGDTPSMIEAQPVKGGFTISADQLIEIGPTLGLRCVNDKQQDGKCSDYEVRYFIGDSSWENKDKPVLKASAGDFETKFDLCKIAEGMAFRKVGTLGTANRAYENVKIGPTFGFQCLHDEQPDDVCEDYKVRFLCPPSTSP